MSEGAGEDRTSHKVADRSTSERYKWGGVSDGWRLVNTPGLSVILERVPAGAAEVRHRHLKAHQFFFVLSGTATIEFDDGEVTFGPGQGLEVEVGLRHRFVNRTERDVEFLTISAPATTGDRIEE